MTFHPVLDRELRLAARRSGTYRLRWMAGLGGCLVVLWVVIADWHANRPTNGGTLFFGLTSLALAFSLLSGAVFTADCLSEEKREGTLGLLFLTELRSFDIVWAKWIANSLHAVYSLLAVLPVLAIPVILGGVSSAEIWRLPLLLMNTLFVSLSAGILASACSQRSIAAQTATLVVVGLLAFGLPILDGWDWTANPTAQTSRWSLGSPVVQFLFGFDSTAPVADGAFWVRLAIANAVGWVLLLGATWILPRTWQAKPISSRPAPWRTWATRPAWWPSFPGPAASPVDLDADPFQWLASRTSLKPASRLLILAVCLVTSLAALEFAASARGFSLLAAVLLLHTMLKVWLGAEASHRFATDRREGTLELLLLTRLTVSEIIAGQTTALVKAFRAPVAAILCFDIVLLALSRPEQFSTDVYLMLASAVLMLLADLYTLAWVGMWTGLASTRSTRAAFVTAGRVLAVPWAVFVGLTLMAGVNPGYVLELCLIWLAIGVFSNLFFWVAARQGLGERFEQLATSRGRLRDDGTSRSDVASRPAIRSMQDVPYPG